MMVNQGSFRAVGVFALVAVFMLTLPAVAGDVHKAANTANNPAPTQYLIQVTHTPEECLQALDEAKALGKDKLDQWNWGCKYGDHTGYLLVNANSKEQALQYVPASKRGSAALLPLSKFTVAEIESFHQMK